MPIKSSLYLIFVLYIVQETAVYIGRPCLLSTCPLSLRNCPVRSSICTVRKFWVRRRSRSAGTFVATDTSSRDFASSTASPQVSWTACIFAVEACIANRDSEFPVSPAGIPRGNGNVYSVIQEWEWEWETLHGNERNGNWQCGKIPAQHNSFNHESWYEVCVVD